MPRGYSVTISPAHLTAPADAVTVSDTGTTVLHIVTQAVSLGKGCSAQSEVTWARVSPASLTLHPGQSRTAHVHLTDVPSGRHDLGIVFETLGGKKGNVSVNGEVSAHMVVGTGGADPCSLSAPQHHASSMTLLLAVSAILALVAIVAIGALLTGRRRGAHHR